MRGSLDRLAALAMILGTGCLPADTRPTPAEVQFTLKTAPATLDGVTTADGWQLRFERVLLAVGNVGFGGEACSDYAGSGYTRVMNGLAAGSQKIGLAYALGDCKFSYRVRVPDADSLLGDGISETDKNVLRIQASDPFVDDSGVSLLVRGSAEKGSVRKTFDWSFRSRLAFDECALDGSTVKLTEDGQRTIELGVHAESLFLDAIELEGATLRFEPFAAADDGDGVLTLDELAKRTIADAGVTLVDAPKEWKSLGDLMYRGSFGRVVRAGDATKCNLRLRQGPPR